MNSLKDGVPVTTAKFINEYRLLGIVKGNLVLLDSSSEFKLESSNITATDVRRTYELDNTQPFRVNPEEGIVVVTVQGYSGGFNALVIPTKVFARFEKRTGLVANSPERVAPTNVVKWETWGRFVIKFMHFSKTYSNVFYTHIHELQPLTTTIDCRVEPDPNSKGTMAIAGPTESYVQSRVFDFSLYCRKWVADNKLKPGPEATYLCNVADSASLRDHLQPLVLTLCNVRTERHEGDKLLPTENGLLIKVRIPVVG